MKVIRVGGDFARKRSKRALIEFTSGLGILLLLLCASGYLVTTGSAGWEVVVAVVMGLPILAFLRSRHRQWGSRRKGIEGEEWVKQLLLRLSDQYGLINDVVLPGRKGNIDHVLVGPCGVVIIETKNYSGSIFCTGDRWFRNRIPIRSPSLQAKAQAASLRDFLADKITGRSDVIRYVQPVVVFTNPLVRLKVRDSTIPTIRFSELLDLVIELGKRRALSPEGIDRVSQCVLNWARVMDRRSK